MAAEMDNLRAAVARVGTTGDAVLARLKDLQARIDSGAPPSGIDPAEVQAAADDLNRKMDDLQAGVDGVRAPPAPPFPTSVP